MSGRPFAFVLLAVAALSAVASAGDEKTSLEAERLFAKRVWPVFAEKCLACHGGDEKEVKGDFRLTSRELLLKGGESGEAGIVPGRPDESLLVRAIRRDGLEMPPKENDRLSPGQIEAVRRWVEAGAPWPDEEARKRLAAEKDEWDAAAGVTVATSGGLSEQWTNRRYDPANLWAYRPLVKPAVPGAPGPQATPVDAFINARLEATGLSPSAPADRRTLIRRVTFDLLGLPPTPEEVEAFVSDPEPDEAAFAKVVDRLLANPHYGEQWGRHWLDVTRYADSSGFANDYERGNAWRYRDYVVRSFNADKPYGRFVREQIAGDELNPDDPECLVAVGFLRMGPWELTGMEVAKVARQRFLDDVTDAVGQVFLSHPLQCARCHDHKFDPIPTRDYYRLQAAFATTQLAERRADFLTEENTSGFEERKYLEARRARYEAELKRIDAKEEAAARAWCAERGIPYVPRKQAVRRGLPEERIAPKGIGLEPADFGMERIARKGLERLGWEFERYEPFALSVYDGPTPNVKSVTAPQRVPAERATGEFDATAILAGGDPFSPTQPVSPGALSAVNALCGGDLPDDDLPADAEGRRAALADWIAHPDNGLAARSVVNRIWAWHFGQGIVATPNNFGATGAKPTHPELLDWLAATFVESGGTFKSLHRVILLSEAYRRSSRHPDPESLKAKDPLGTLYAAFPPRRLTAEEIRDAALAASGELNPELGGIPVRPEINAEAALQPRQVMGTFAAAWVPSPNPADRHRRSLYALQLRGLRDPLMETFNQPGPDLPCERRDASTVTPQVFALFNGQAAHDRALAFAARLMKEAHPLQGAGLKEADRAAVIDRAFRLTFGREPDAAERAACLRHWERVKAHAMAAPSRTAPVVEVTREAVEENTGEKFTFVERLDACDDFVPDLKPWDADAETRALADVCLVLLNANEFVYLD